MSYGNEPQHHVRIVTPMSTLSFEDRPWLPFSVVREVYLELGVGDGSSFSLAGHVGFRRCLGCEICVRQYVSEESRGVLASDCKSRVFNVPSVPFLQGVCPQLRSRATTIFIDSHAVGSDLHDDFDPEYGQCPLRAELEAILAVDWKVWPLIAIDDYDQLLLSGEPGSFWDRKPVNANFRPSDWPTIIQVREKMRGWSEHIEKREDGQLLWYYRL